MTTTDQDDSDQTPVPTETPALAADTPAPAPVTVEDDDPDTIELKAAQVAAKEASTDQPEGSTDAEAEAEGAEKPEGEQPKDEAQGAPGTPGAPEKGKAKGEVVMIPKPRLDEVAGERDEALRWAHYWRGVAEGRGTQAPAPGPSTSQAPEQTFEEQLAALAEQEDAVEKKYEDGELSGVEKAKQLRELRNQEYNLREAKLTASIKPQTQQPPQADLRLQELTAALEEAHPFTQHIKDPEHWQFLEREAVKSLAKEGVNIPRDQVLPPDMAYTLRARIAELTDVYGEQLTGKPAGEVLKAGATPKPGGLSPQAAARLKKLGQASEAPVDIHSLGTPGTTVPEFKDSQIAGMSDEEILERLPRSTRDRLLGVNP